MRPRLATVALVVAAAWSFVLGAPAGARAADGNLPAFRATTITGETLELGDHLGRDVIVMSFWATWCEPCKAEMPTLQAMHERYAAEGLQIISVSIDDAQTQSAVRPYVSTQGYTFPVVVDEGSSIVQAYNPSAAVPYTLFIGRDGRVHKRVTGFKPSESGEIEAEIRALLGIDGDRDADLSAGVTLEVTESLSLDWHWTLDDPQIVREEDRDHVFDLRNRLNVRLRFDRFTFGTRLDLAWFPNPPSSQYQSDVRPEELFVTGRFGDVTVTLGDDYLTFGRGLALSLRKIDELGVSTSLRGAHVSARTGALTTRVAVGLTNTVNVDGIDEKLIPDPNDLIIAGRVEVAPIAALRLGAHVVDVERRHSDARQAIAGALTGDDDDRPLSGGDRLIRSTVVGGTLELPSIADALSVYLEADALIGEERQSGAAGERVVDERGLALYGSVQAFFQPWTLLFEAKHYDNYTLAPSPHPDTENVQGLPAPLPYIIPPTLERIDQRVQNNTDVTGLRVRADHALADSPHSVFLSAAWFGDAPAREEYTVHAYGGYEHTGEGGNRVLVQAGYRHEEAPDANIVRLRMVHLDLDWFHVFSGHLDMHVHVNHEFRGANIGADALEDHYVEGTTYVTFNLPPRWSFTAQLEYLTDDATSDPLFPGAFVQLFITDDSFLRLFVGRGKGGLKCAGGVCRIFPDFEGVKLDATLRF